MHTAGFCTWNFSFKIYKKPFHVRKPCRPHTHAFLGGLISVACSKVCHLIMLFLSLGYYYSGLWRSLQSAAHTQDNSQWWRDRKRSGFEFVSLGSLLEAMFLNTQPTGSALWGHATVLVSGKSISANPGQCSLPGRSGTGGPLLVFWRDPAPGSTTEMQLLMLYSQAHCTANITSKVPISFTGGSLISQHRLELTCPAAGLGKSNSIHNSSSYLRSFLRLRNSFLVCAISTSWGIGW